MFYISICGNVNNAGDPAALRFLSVAVRLSAEFVGEYALYHMVLCVYGLYPYMCILYTLSIIIAFMRASRTTVTVI